ncbi:MAG: hypothetical protein RL662_106, partial [Bacteroidota bacterium]
HLLYNTDTIYIDSKIKEPLSIVLTPKTHLLKETQVTARAPLMKLDDNTLSYNAQIIKDGRAVTNAYEIVKEVPGVMEINGSLSLAGSEKLNIIVNGQTTTMTLAQVTNMLKSMPASNIQSVDVMYNPESRYNVKGTLINVVLTKKTAVYPLLTGELSASYRQAFYASNSDRLSLSYNKNKVSIDLFGNINFGKDWNKNASQSIHQLKNRSLLINETLTNTSDFFNSDFRLGLNYKTSKTGNLAFSYYFDNNKKNSENFAINNYFDGVDYNINSLNHRKNRNQLHNMFLQYTTKDIKVGIDYTFYKDPIDQHYSDEQDGIPRLDYLNNSTQEISKWSAFFDYSTKPFNDMKINYGFISGYNNSDTEVRYSFKNGNIYEEDKEIRVEGQQNDYTVTPYIDLSYKFNDKLTASASAKVEYFKSDYNHNGNKTTLWNDWTVFPKASISYTQSSRNIFQLNISSDKNYPSFWSINPQVTDLNSYSQIVGNPHLKPSKTYRGQLMYIRDRKCFIIGYIQYTPDYFIQLPHMSDDELKTIYRFENYDYLLRSGLTLVTSLRKGTFYNSRITLQGIMSREKMDNFYDSSFDNVSYTGVVMLNNSFTFSKNILLQIDGLYQSKSRQGVYKLGEVWKLSSKLRWTINKDIQLIAEYNNILRHEMPKPMKLEYNNQYKRTEYFEKSTFALTLTWRFGNYKAAKYAEVDRSRLGK